jgi:hypothetical protein
MNMDDLKAAWRAEIAASLRTEDLQMTALVKDVTRLQRGVRMRDFWMIFALACAAAISLAVGWLAPQRADWMTRIGVSAFVLGTIGVGVALYRARRVTRSDDWSLRSRIEIEIERIEKQRRLLKRVGIWFLIPMLIAADLSSLGGYHSRTGSYVPDAFGWLFYLGTAVFYGFTYALVQREVRTTWEPVLARLRRLLAEL